MRLQEKLSFMMNPNNPDKNKLKQDTGINQIITTNVWQIIVKTIIEYRLGTFEEASSIANTILHNIRNSKTKK